MDDEGAEEGAQEGAQGASDAERRAVAAAVADMLAEKAPMLREYFAVDIDEETKALTAFPRSWRATPHPRRACPSLC